LSASFWNEREMMMVRVQDGAVRIGTSVKWCCWDEREMLLLLGVWGERMRSSDGGSADAGGGGGFFFFFS
jgi:hypothetical protein